MAERLIEILVPDDRAERVRGRLSDADLPWLWSQSAEGEAIFKLLVEAEEVEAVLDSLQPEVAACKEARVLVLAVEARIPKREDPPQPPPPDASQPSPKPKSKHRISREELYEDLAGMARTDGIYLTMVVLASMVCAGGLAKDSPALLVGAMIIAPLLGPNLALTLATTLGDRELGAQALRTTGAGFLAAVGISLLYGLLWPPDPTIGEVAARTTVDLADVLIALATGIAAALSATTAAVSTLVGVMVAVAMLPPLMVTCSLAVSGQFELATGALLLLTTNVVCVNLAGIATFYAQGVRPRTWWEGAKARRATRNAIAIWTCLLAIVIALILLAA